MTDNFHASAVVLGDRGIVIAGESGSGKTQLALVLISHARSFGLFARLIADDQILLSAHHGRLVCAAPPSIAGLAEVRGLGPWPVEHEAKAPVDLVVRLVERDAAERFPGAETEVLLGCHVPLLRLADDDRQTAMMAVIARFSLSPFHRKRAGTGCCAAANWSCGAQIWACQRFARRQDSAPADRSARMGASLGAGSTECR
jgi:serine kinase of HPr protein (carbohydrate metabolism regulator)